jgi:hypothetical protein
MRERRIMGLTFQQKVGALLDFGLVETREEAIGMLIDMGETDDDPDNEYAAWNDSPVRAVNDDEQGWYPGESDSAYGPLD